MPKADAPAVGPGPAELAAVERRLDAILEPYRDRLEAGVIYGMATLRRPGAKAHDWFAGVQRVDGAVKFNFLPMYAHPELLDGASAGLLKRRTGASVFRFSKVDEAELAELEGVVAQGFQTYMRGR